MRKNRKNHDLTYESFDQGWIGIVTRINSNSNSISNSDSSSFSTSNSSRTLLSEASISGSESDSESQYSIIDPSTIVVGGGQSRCGSDVAVASILQYDSSVENDDDEENGGKNELLLSDSPLTLEITFNSFLNNDTVEIKDENTDEIKALSATNNNLSKQSEGELLHRNALFCSSNHNTSTEGYINMTTKKGGNGEVDTTPSNHVKDFLERENYKESNAMPTLSQQQIIYTDTTTTKDDEEEKEEEHQNREAEQEQQIDTTIIRNSHSREEKCCCSAIVLSLLRQYRLRYRNT